jgi:hypothetical protein
MARSMLSFGMLCARAVVTAVRKRGLALMSPPPIRAATVISLISLVKILPRLESLSAFLCLIVLHLEWPDMTFPFPRHAPRWTCTSSRRRVESAATISALRQSDGSARELP